MVMWFENEGEMYDFFQNNTWIGIDWVTFEAKKIRDLGYILEVGDVVEEV